MDKQRNPFPARTVVIVEDEFLVRDLAVSELEDNGFTVVEFETADDALPYLEAHGGEAALILTDVQMPGRLDGLGLVDRLRRLWPDVPVLVTSGGPLVDPRKLPARVTFLSKPWTPAAMVDRVNRIVAQ